MVDLARELSAFAMVEAAAQYLRQPSGAAPNPATLVAALKSVEKQAKKANAKKSNVQNTTPTAAAFTYSQLIGTWRLGFVSGTKTVSPRPGATPVKKLGKGRFLPRFVSIEITYSKDTELLKAPDQDQAHSMGNVINAVKLAGLNFQLQGPTRFWAKSNSLGFDFTQLQLGLGPVAIYKGGIRGGKDSEQTFREKALKDQAFFTFFLVEPDYIAARGRGGGLALWTRVKPDA